jgi:hypothetical protein
VDRSIDRLALLRALYELGRSPGPRSPAAVAAFADDTRSRFATLLAERPYRTALALVTSRALARAGDGRGAATRLREAIAAGDGSIDLSWRLAHLEAVAGELDVARRRAEALVTAGGSSRASYDVTLLLVRLLAETKDRERLRDLAPRVLPGALAGGERERLVGVVNLRAHLLLDELGPEDLSAESSAYLPEGEALACLARWRTGRSAPGDAEAMERGARENPDAATEFRLARAAALLGAGRALEALEAATGLVNVLQEDARVDFASRQTLDFAEALRVKALAEAGQAGRAREEAGRLRGRLRPGLLPRALVDEVLRTGPTPAG